MDDDLLTLLRTSKIFLSLPKRACIKLAPKFHRIELAQDDILYYQGDISDSIDLILSGRLESILTDTNGVNRVISDIAPGETVGELGSLSGEPRTTTIKAKTHSILFKLPSEAFRELCHQYPAVLFALINPIMSRSQQMVKMFSSEKFRKHIVIMPANDEISLQLFSHKLMVHMETIGSLILLSDYTDEFDTDAKIHAIIEKSKIENPKKAKQRFIYLIKSSDTTLAKYALENADIIYVVGDKNVSASLSAFTLASIAKLKSVTKTTLPELIMLHDKYTQLPRNTSSWLQLTEFGLHHHVRIDRSADYRRLLRFMRNKAVGLVLSGGGTRGWAHAGAIKALTEAGIPIDAVGATSVGAVVGASYAVTLSDTQTLKQFQTIMEHARNSVSLRNLTWPSISLFNARGLTGVIEKLFGGINIEDLWIPYFCVSTNLAKNIEAIHNSGTLWEKIRGSVAIPGVIPPVIINGQMHFDGGLLNNLPVDIMRKIVTNRGTIVAIELSGIVNDDQKYSFPPTMGFWQALLGKFGITYHYKFPRFIDTFLKSLLTGSFVKSQQNSLLADIMVNLDLARFPMLHSNRKVENKIVEIGFETTMKQIKNMKVKK